MIGHTNPTNSVSTQRGVNRLKVLTLSLILGVLGIILLLSLLHTGAVALASQRETIPSNSTHDIPSSPTAPTATTAPVTKTVVPTLPNTGGIVSICFAIGGIGPWKLDVALVQDVSWSMDDPITDTEGLTQTLLEASQNAASAFVSILSDTDRVAVISYSFSAQLAQPLTTTKSVVTETIYDLEPATVLGTNTGEGIRVAHGELITSTRHETDTVKAIILLSDGVANCDIETGVCNDDDHTTLERAEDYAITQTTLAVSNTIRIYTIGFGVDVDEDLLRKIADIGHGEYFFAPDADALETIYQTIAWELHKLTITDILTPGVETDCSQWPDDRCIVSPSGVTTLTFPISDSLLISSPVAGPCFTATVNLDPGYEGPINLPESCVSYQSSDGPHICEPFDNPTVTVGGRMVTGYVYYDVNGNKHRDAGETGLADAIVKTSTDMSTTTDISGHYVLRTSSEPTMSVTTEVPSGYVATTAVSKVIPAGTGSYTAMFGIRTQIYLPLVAKRWPPIINGGFEAGWTGWTHGGELAQTITSMNSQSGNFSALLGDPAYACQNGVPVGSAWMEQTFYVPDAGNPSLSFWYNIVTQDINPQFNKEIYDSFDVRINGVRQFWDAKIDGDYGCTSLGTKDLSWQHREIDLADYRGEYITIRFENWNRYDGWYNTWTFVDDVRFVP